MSDKDLRPSASYIWLEQDGKVLLHERVNTGYMDGMYQMPAGHVDAGEVPSEAVIRESYEELGITLSPEDVSICLVLSRVGEDMSYYDFFFKASAWEGEPKIMEPHKCSDLQWFPLDELPANIIPYNKTVIELVQRGFTFVEEGKDF